jgi:hypothetical protein
MSRETWSYSGARCLVHRWVAAHERFPGVLFLPRSLPQSSVGRHVELLERWLRNPDAMKAGAAMPDYNLSEDHIDAPVAYLQSLE